MSIPQQVTKTHATGNDFVVYADPEGRFEPTADEVRFLDDRHFGIGGDGVIRLAHPEDVSDLTHEQVAECREAGAEWFMDYRNSDGSLAQMCGNGTRAITLFAYDRGYASGEAFRLGTRAGVKILTSLGDDERLGHNVFRVEMGAWKRGELDAFDVTIPGTPGSARGTYVDMGNPHVVAVLEDGKATLPAVESLDLVTKPVVDPVLESDQNVEFVRIDTMDAEAGEGTATMRVNERGCGETLSCGTGLCATAVTLRAKTGIDHWTITVRGGVLRIDVSDTDVKLTGSATLVGDITLL
ncbi:diaminopimelate epimerase [Bifidobacterium sp. 64T4]|uniref:diaminopimelate epimerase n=1 Tax=Bifidobacterium pongonis TaxID=2834432 RepID=UPI001C58D489|nr:diaminopimelate epimerase [Bifidobacterium pongonis]MBW3095058.1 diaminopimelate epimerase [Bifidobacterium pongonis]